MMCPTVICSIFSNGLIYEVVKNRINPYLLSASLTATAQATVIPTMGLLPKLNPLINACYYVSIRLNMYCEKADFSNG